MCAATSLESSNFRIQQYQKEIVSILSKFKKNGIQLHSTWTLYVDQRPDSGSSLADYAQNLRKIYTFSTIEEFWNVFESIPGTSELPIKCSYHLMRGTRRPIWEDKENKNGGYWTFKCQKNYSADIWRNLVLAAVGEQFVTSPNNPNADKIVGITFGSRFNSDHFQVWNENSKEAHNALVIEKVTSEMLPLAYFDSVYYKEHQKHNDFNNLNKSDSANYHKNFWVNQQFTRTIYERVPKVQSQKYGQ